MRPLLHKYFHAIFPCGPSTKHSRKPDTGFDGEFQSKAEGVVAHAFGQVNERNRSAGRGAQEILPGLLTRVKNCSIGGWRSLDEGKVDGHADFQYINAVPRL